MVLKVGCNLTLFVAWFHMFT